MTTAAPDPGHSPDPNPSTPTSSQPADDADKAEKKRRADERPPWWLMLALSTAVVACVVFFGFGPESARVITLELLLGACALSVGGLLGFLFGIPRTAPRIASATADAAPAEEAKGRPEASERLRYQPSTNLEQVSDWLTKILIGVGLVEFDKGCSALQRVGSHVQGQVGGSFVGVSAITQAVLVIFAATGFLCSFWWTRIYYGAIQADADSEIDKVLREVRREVKAEANELKAEANELKAEANEAKMAAAEALDTAAALSHQASSAPKTQELDWPEELRAKVDKLRNYPKDWDTDPGAELFSARESENGRILSAVINREWNGVLVITLRVERRGGSPLEGTVTFLLHPTFRNNILTVPVKDQVAKTKIHASGYFTVVAIADGGKTVLAYNLRSLPNAPTWFLNN